MQRHGHKHVLAINGAEDLIPLIASLARPGGAVVCLGAGSITGWAAGLEAALTSREAKR
jgi:UDP-N-acetylmuramate--alanine ligase